MNIFAWISRKVKEAIFAGVREAFHEMDTTPRDEMLAKLGIADAPAPERIEDHSAVDVVDEPTNGRGKRKTTVRS